MARCRSCDAPVVWAKTANGKMMPLDANEDGSPAEFPDGNILLASSGVDGQYAQVAIVSASGSYKSHFATCPNAGQHRRKG